MRKIVIKEKRYDIDWLRNGFCYRTTLDCPWSAVLDAKRTAKLLGEKIEYSHSSTREYEVSVSKKKAHDVNFFWNIL